MTIESCYLYLWNTNIDTFCGNLLQPLSILPKNLISLYFKVILLSNNMYLPNINTAVYLILISTIRLRKHSCIYPTDITVMNQPSCHEAEANVTVSLCWQPIPSIMYVLHNKRGP